MKSREESIAAWKSVFKAWLIIAVVGFAAIATLDWFGINDWPGRLWP